MTNPRYHATVLRTALVLLFGCATYAILGQSGEGRLRVEIRDKATGKVVPAMVCVTSLADGMWRTPSDGRAQPAPSTVRDFMEPPAWKPGDIGPVRLTKGEGSKGNKRLGVYDGLSDYPFWDEPAAWFVSQPFSMTLPAGKWRLAVERGIEYLPVFEEIEIAPGQEAKRTVQLARWVDMPSQGWYSGDDHVHFPRFKPEHDQLLMTWARAEDVHVANILRMGDIRTTYFEPAGYGKASRRQEGDYVLVTGQECPRNDIPEQGHSMALNISAPVRDTTKYHLYDFMFDAVHAQGGLTGYPHLAWAPEFHRRADAGLMPTWDTNINVVRGKVDFFEILQFRKLGLEDFYDFLNLGIKITASAGSDLPWGNTIGEARVFAYTGRDFSPDAWFAAIKQGRTFVTNGPMLAFTVNNALPGSDLRVTKGAMVKVRARAWAPAIIGSPRKLEIVSQGKVIRTVESADPAKGELNVEFEVRADQGRWLAARVTSHNGALAHTSPVYVMLESGGFIDRAQAAPVARKRLAALEFIEERLKRPQITRSFAPGEKEALEERIGQARGRYRSFVPPGEGNR